jgi:hypothetical protein
VPVEGLQLVLIAAGELKDNVKAVIYMGGPDLAKEDVLMCVEAPTLFIVGGKETEVIDYNQWA